MDGRAIAMGSIVIQLSYFPIHFESYLARAFIVRVPGYAMGVGKYTTSVLSICRTDERGGVPLEQREL